MVFRVFVLLFLSHSNDMFQMLFCKLVLVEYNSIHLIFTGHALDILARVPLWKYGLDYRHGTGHGIGSYLNVHEGNYEVPLLILYSPMHSLI